MCTVQLEANIKFLFQIPINTNYALKIDEVNVSSTKIRRAILNGEMEVASAYLGEPFELHGKVIDGNTIGRDIGFPTANIDIESITKLIPKIGVYAVNVVLNDGEIHEGMLNIGLRPTIANYNNISIEVNIFDFDGDLYDQYITIQLLSRSRDEMKFDSIVKLKEQLIKDEKNIRDYFSSVM